MVKIINFMLFFFYHIKKKWLILLPPTFYTYRTRAVLNSFSLLLPVRCRRHRSSPLFLLLTVPEALQPRRGLALPWASVTSSLTQEENGCETRKDVSSVDPKKLDVK